MENTVLNMALGSAISVGISVIGWYVFQRREERRDQEVTRLRDEVKTLREDKMKEFDDRLTTDHKAHAALHEKINDLPHVFVPRSECDILCGGIERIVDQQRIQGARLEEIAGAQAKTGSVVELIATRMNISFEGAPHGPH